ncbi:ABC transporter ATP-binding protein [Halapricum hydrolyticum]|uniref:Cobalamin import ATP-binding protein BtuD n=1 Tax=Halapricum hydrolyticum TaxID=2979991 RepID=A0AAE3LEQ2_9EURY|nr:ABC transporter ATP-binding protein [Halapricum hydrolyticum]MCU4718244.1 ABC transporter ATP-binding protein [Halapricum hydrolyticum]MCU4726315.1 ABC transporter ATP-binding protein [Halapricum hydrolyticum]
MTLDVRDLAFAYGDESVLEGVNLTAESGELLGLLGPNGSGKSTLLQSLNRIHEPDAGTVLVDGDRVSELDRTELARRVGYVPQDEQGAFPATVYETILQGRRPHGGWSPGRVDRAAVEGTIEQLDLAAFTSRNVADLSGGQRQKVRLGRALVGDPSVLLLDEPTSALDLKHQLDVMELVGEHVRDRGVTGIVAIHDLNLAARYCDRVALLSNGEIYDVGGPDVLTPETIRAVYGVEATVKHHRGRRLIVTERSARTPSVASAAHSGPDDGRYCTR